MNLSLITSVGVGLEKSGKTCEFLRQKTIFWSCCQTKEHYNASSRNPIFWQQDLSFFLIFGFTCIWFLEIFSTIKFNSLQIFSSVFIFYTHALGIYIWFGVGYPTQITCVNFEKLSSVAKFSIWLCRLEIWSPVVKIATFNLSLLGLWSYQII